MIVEAYGVLDGCVAVEIFNRNVESWHETTVVV